MRREREIEVKVVIGGYLPRRRAASSLPHRNDYQNHGRYSCEVAHTAVCRPIEQGAGRALRVGSLLSSDISVSHNAVRMIVAIGMATLKVPTDGEIKTTFEGYVGAVGRVAHASNYLQEQLGQLFALVTGGPFEVAMAVWYAVPNDRTHPGVCLKLFEMLCERLRNHRRC
jgi:hypothetical protein